MKFSPDGEHLLGGVGKGYITIDGTEVVANAGGWDWLYNTIAAGCGELDTPQQGFYQYNYVNGAYTPLASGACTSFFANGNGYWLAYYAGTKKSLTDGLPGNVGEWVGSFDSNGGHWPQLAALGIVDDHRIFTDSNNVNLVIMDSSYSVTVVNNPAEWTPVGNSFFSRRFAGAYSNGTFYACGWMPQYSGTCVWQPFNSNSPIWRISSTETDFNPTIAHRNSNGLLVVGTGKNQGERGQTVYTIDVSNHTFKVDSGGWMPLVDAVDSLPKPVDIAMFPRKILFAPFFSFSQRYGDTGDFVGNVAVITETGETIGRQPYAYIVSTSNLPDLTNPTNLNPVIAWWFGVEGGSTLDLAKDGYMAAASLPEKPIILYMDNRNWPAQLPSWVKKNRTWIGVQAYRGLGETVAEFDHNITAVMDRVKQYGLPIVLIPQFYDRSHAMPLPQVVEIQPLFEKWIRNYNVIGVMPFSDRRPGGMTDLPILKEFSRKLYNAVPGRPNRYDNWTPDNSPVDFRVTLLAELSRNKYNIPPQSNDYLIGLVKKDLGI